MKTLSIANRARVAFLIGFSLAAAASAHDPGLSTLTVQLRPDIADATLVLSVRDAEALGGAGAACDSAGWLSGRAVRDALEFRCDGRPAVAQIIAYHVDGASNATVQMRIPIAGISKLELRSKCFARLPPGHRQFVTIQNGRGEALASRLLSAQAASLTLPLPLPDAGSSSGWKSEFVDFLFLGVKHILTGYDHLLFLFSLLLVTRSIVPTLKIITAFTAAHSITLALAALNIVRVPAGIVEPIIAASIIYVGVENVVRGEMPKGRALLAFAFGLVHGLGFAAALREAGLGADGPGIVAPLVSFNLGVELGQLAVAVIALPVIWKLTACPRLAKRWVGACSALVILAGSYWLVQRVWPS